MLCSFVFIHFFGLFTSNSQNTLQYISRQQAGNGTPRVCVCVGVCVWVCVCVFLNSVEFVSELSTCQTHVLSPLYIHNS